MFERAHAVRPLCIGLFFIALGCSVPPLESQFEHGPTVKHIVSHIEDELASLVNGVKVDEKNHVVTVTNNKRLARRICDDRYYPQAARDLHRLLSHLTQAHFVASASMTLDVMDAEGINPSLTFITPLNMAGTFSRTGTIGGSLNGTQERNIQLSYSIDFDKLPTRRSFVLHCDLPRYGITEIEPESSVGLVGDLGLTDIVIDGLAGLEASGKANIYGNSGPVGPTVTRSLVTSAVVLDQTGKATKKQQEVSPTLQVDENPQTKDKLTIISGSLTLAPSATAASALGTATLAASAKLQDPSNPKLFYEYFINVSGPSLTVYAEGKNNPTEIDVSLTGPMTQAGQRSKTDFDFSQTLNLAGKIPIYRAQPYLPCLYLSGTLGSSNYKAKLYYTDLPPGPKETTYCDEIRTIESAQPKPKERPPQTDSVFTNLQLGGPSPGGAKGAAPATPSAAGSSTLFGTLVNFMVSYGLNGGPNWTLQTFKGPSGGGGGGGGSSGSGGGNGGASGGGQLLNLSRTDTDTLTITFVAACQDKASFKVRNYWQSLPECDQAGGAKSGANGLAFQNNLLILSGRGL